jgi:hypothetical protein
MENLLGSNSKIILLSLLCNQILKKRNIGLNSKSQFVCVCVLPNFQCSYDPIRAIAISIFYLKDFLTTCCKINVMAS